MANKSPFEGQGSRKGEAFIFPPSFYCLNRRYNPGMSKRRATITLLCVTGILSLSAAIAVPIRQRSALSHAKSRADVESLFGMPRKTFSDVEEIKNSFGAKWNFHNLSNGNASLTDELPPVVEQACLYQWAIFEYLVYFDGDAVISIFQIGTN